MINAEFFERRSKCSYINVGNAAETSTSQREIATAPRSFKSKGRGRKSRFTSSLTATRRDANSPWSLAIKGVTNGQASDCHLQPMQATHRHREPHHLRRPRIRSVVLLPQPAHSRLLGESPATGRRGILLANASSAKAGTMQLDYSKLRVYCERCGTRIVPQDGFVVLFCPERYYHPRTCFQDLLLEIRLGETTTRSTK